MKTNFLWFKVVCVSLILNFRILKELDFDDDLIFSKDGGMVFVDQISQIPDSFNLVQTAQDQVEAIEGIQGAYREIFSVEGGSDGLSQSCNVPSVNITSSSADEKYCVKMLKTGRVNAKALQVLERISELVQEQCELLSDMTATSGHWFKYDYSDSEKKSSEKLEGEQW